MSFPERHSVNDGIPSDLCSLKYSTVAYAVELIQCQGKDALLSMLDLTCVSLMVPEDHCLLGNGQVYVDTCLPFGLCSAPKIFSAVADGIAWVMHCKGLQSLIHYLDDFLLVGPPGNLASCQSDLWSTLEMCTSLGFPVSLEKVEGPSTTIVFLGMEIDSSRFELRLPKEKLTRLKAFTSHWLAKRVTTKLELQSIIGHLSHAATVVTAGDSSSGISLRPPNPKDARSLGPPQFGVQGRYRLVALIHSGVEGCLLHAHMEVYLY